MEAGSLQRSTTSFRRQGSSGLVWDDKFLSEELKQNKEKTEGPSYGKMQRNRSAGASKGGAYRTVKVSTSPNIDPSSPKVSGCGLCGILGKLVSNTLQKKSRKSR